MSATTPTDQRQLAERLTREMVECGYDVSELDLLDSLASTGLELSEGDTASEAYQQAIKERT